MAEETVSALFHWGQELARGSNAAGFPMQTPPDAGDVKDFVTWARVVGAGMAGFMTLPALADDADFSAALGWAKAVDQAVRQFGAQLPALPQA